MATSFVLFIYSIDFTNEVGFYKTNSRLISYLKLPLYISLILTPKHASNF